MQEVFLWTVLLSSVVEVIPCTFCTSQSCCALLHAVKRSFGTVGPGIPACEMFIGNSWARHPSLCEMFIGTVGPGIPACVKCLWCSVGTVGPGIPACVKCSLEELGQAFQPVRNVHCKQSGQAPQCVCVWTAHWEHLGQASQPVWNVHWEHLGQASQPVWNVHWEHLGQASQHVWNIHWEHLGQASQPVIRLSGRVRPVIPVCEMFIGNSWARHPSLCEMWDSGARHWKWLSDTFIGNSWASRSSVWNIHDVHWEQLG